MKVVVAHPGKQHSFQLATAMKKKEVLYKYITTVYNKKHSLTSVLLKFVNGDLKKKINGRKCENLLEQDVVQYKELGVIITLFLNRFPKLQRFAEWWNKYIESSFYSSVMKYVKKECPDCVVYYNGYSDKKLNKLDGTNIVKIMDVSIAQRKYVREILQKETDKIGDDEMKKMHFSYWNDKMLEDDVMGCRKTDFFLVPSQFVKESLIYSGVNESQIKLVPYGVDIEKFQCKKMWNDNGKLKLLFVGSVTLRKGIHRLFEAIEGLNNVEVYLAGVYYKSSSLYKQHINDNRIHFLGFVTRDKLSQLYKDCDVFVLPSFCEGMAMVGLEAMASGLPLLCTTYTGVNDVVEVGKNGYVYEADDVSTLRNYIIWFSDNRKAIEEMGKEARRTALRFSWDIYHENVYNAICECVKGIE